MSTTTVQPESRAERPPFQRRRRLVVTLLAVLLFVGLPPMGIVAWKMTKFNREQLHTATQEYQLLLASSMAQKLDIHVNGLREQLTRLASTIAETGGAADRQEVERTLGAVVDGRMPYLRYTQFASSGSRAVSAGELPPSVEPTFAAGLEDAVETLTRLGADHTIVSDPVLLADRPPRAVLVISAPVVARDRIRGVLSCLVDLQTVWRSVVESSRSGHTIYATDALGRVFASTNPVRVRPSSVIAESPLVHRFRTAEGRARETMPFSEFEAGAETDYLGSYEVTRQGWGIFVQARLDDVYTPARRMVESTVTWALGAVGIGILVSIFFAGTLSTPIKRLAAASRAFAKGDFSTRVTVASGNEISELAHTFNTMADEIEDHIRRLRKAAVENRELFLGTIHALAQAIDAKDPYTRGHSARVNRYSVIIAKELGLDHDELGDIHVASLMHDVGKIGINDAILQKPGKLTDDEFEIMKTHTTLGASIMAPIRRMQPIIPGLRWHHERFGGGGYPDGLAGEKIPLMARIIAVADAFDAMTTHRPYQTAMTFDAAHQRLNDLKGVAFDERIVEAFNRAYLRGRIRVEDVDADLRAPQPETPAPALAT